MTPPYLPHDIDLEQAILGAVLLDNEAYAQASRIIGPEDFFDPVHAEMFEAAGETIRAGGVYDPRTAKVLLTVERIGEVDSGEYLGRVVGEASGLRLVPNYAKVLAELAAKRRLAEACAEAQRSALNGGKPLDVVSSLEDQIAAVRASLRGGSAQQMKAHAQSVIDTLAGAYRRGDYDGVCWPLSEINSVMSGPMEAGNLYGFLAASGEGKTSCMLQIARHAAEQGYPTLLISYDQRGDQCLRQMASQAIGIAVDDMRRGAVSDAEFDAVYEELGRITKLPFEVEKLARGKVAMVMNIARSFVKRRKGEKPCLVMIDHIKRVEPERAGDDAGTRVNLITSALKGMSEELGCATLLANQRNSAGLRRPNPRPTDEDLFGGAGAKEDYDAILTLYRAEKWLRAKLKIAERPSEKDQIEEKLRRAEGLAEFSTLKNRYGEEGRDATVKFVARFTRFVSPVSERAAEAPELWGRAA